MTKRMLIDATHPEETRAVVLDGHYLADFDFETSTKRQLKGNIYLAKVTRVEPSLQAAFVDYGGNRHGFLAFSEIHPDYFQVPQADRALLDEIEREVAVKAAAGDHDADGNGDAGNDGSAESEAEEERSALQDEQARRRARLLRSYKIQEVIKRRQIMLVQVVKEERGNKGAALTTYLSLAGRYCVLMPNTPRGGGISRKISDATDRKRLKEIAQELEIPQGMGLIIRTAGQERSKAEIRRDYEYLLRLWNEIRETTLQSIAPKLIYEEGDLIKRALRDLYSRDIEEVLVEGEEGYKNARRLMTMLMPSRARLVKKYEDPIPAFFRYHVEEQLDGMHSPVVQLRSGGSIVLHTTEALTAIDVNSGRSTRERHIDETALKTNLEAADEIARQLRLRDVAGLIVIDFIDMAEGRHQRAVEKRLRDALKLDRARIQIGKISQFGLLELSRQRLRASLLELSCQVCPVCAGTGVIRSTEGCALQALRAVQEQGIRNEAAALRIDLPTDVALYLLNHKRDTLSRLEERYAMRVHVAVEPDLHAGEMRLDILERREREVAVEAPVAEEAGERRDRHARNGERRGRQERAERQERPEPPPEERERQEQPAAEPVEPAGPEPVQAGAEDGEEQAPRRRRRRRRRRRGGEGVGNGMAEAAQAEGMAEGDEDEAEPETVEAVVEEGPEWDAPAGPAPEPEPGPLEPPLEIEPLPVAAAAEPDEEPPAAGEEPPAVEEPPAAEDEPPPVEEPPPAGEEAPAIEEPPAAEAQPRRRRRSTRSTAEAEAEAAPRAPRRRTSRRAAAAAEAEIAAVAEVPAELVPEHAEPEPPPAEAAGGQEPGEAFGGLPPPAEVPVSAPGEAAAEPLPESSGNGHAPDDPLPAAAAPVAEEEQPEAQEDLREGEQRPVRQGWWSRWVR